MDQVDSRDLGASSVEGFEDVTDFSKRLVFRNDVNCQAGRLYSLESSLNHLLSVSFLFLRRSITITIILIISN